MCAFLTSLCLYCMPVLQEHAKGCRQHAVLARAPRVRHVRHARGVLQRGEAAATSHLWCMQHAVQKVQFMQGGGVSLPHPPSLHQLHSLLCLTYRPVLTGPLCCASRRAPAALQSLVLLARTSTTNAAPPTRSTRKRSAAHRREQVQWTECPPPFGRRAEV